MITLNFHGPYKPSVRLTGGEADTNSFASVDLLAKGEPGKVFVHTQAEADELIKAFVLAKDILARRDAALAALLAGRQLAALPQHDLMMPHDVRYIDDGVRGCPPNCPRRLAAEAGVTP